MSIWCQTKAMFIYYKPGSEFFNKTPLYWRFKVILPIVPLNFTKILILQIKPKVFKLHYTVHCILGDWSELRIVHLKTTLHSVLPLQWVLLTLWHFVSFIHGQDTTGYLSFTGKTGWRNAATRLINCTERYYKWWCSHWNHGRCVWPGTTASCEHIF